MLKLSQRRLRPRPRLRTPLWTRFKTMKPRPKPEPRHGRVRYRDHDHHWQHYSQSQRRWNSFLQLGFFPAANDRCLWVSSEWDRSCLAAVYEMVMNCQRATVFHSTKATIDHTSTFGRQYNSKPLKTIHHCTKLHNYNKTTVHHNNP